MESLWNGFAKQTLFPVLGENLNVDVAIIGGGITGISTAFELSRNGLQVAVLEARTVGGGTTAHSTGNLYSMPDRSLKHMLRKHGAKNLQLLLQARRQAIDTIEAHAHHFALDCDFKRVPWFLYAADDESATTVVEEWEAAQEVGLAATLHEMKYPYRPAKAILVPHQAQFNPRLYVQELADRIQSGSCRIFEHTPVREIDVVDDYHVLTTERGALVRALRVVHATHTPKGFDPVQAFLGPYREYGVACALPPVDFSGIYWGHHGREEFFSSRLYKRGDSTYLVVVGQPHKVGQKEDNRESLERLKEFARRHFTVENFQFEWGGQHYRPADDLPYIGLSHEREWIATGFSTHGLVYGVLAASMIRRQIQGEPAEEIDGLLSPRRLDLVKSIPKFVKENLNVAAQYLKDWPLPPETKELADIPRGAGRIIEHQGFKLAAYRDEGGKVSVCSAVCPHMKCIVHFNPAEKSWDCPCHGSRFDLQGRVLEGPALTGLKNHETPA